MISLLRKYKILAVVCILVFGFLAGGYLYFNLENLFHKEIAILSNNQINIPEFKNRETVDEREEIREEITEERTVLPIVDLEGEPVREETPTATNSFLEIPFTPQVPFVEWAEPIYQDGCEEASSLMAVYWALGKSLTKEEAKEQILAISNYQTEHYGEYRDTSSQDTAERIIKGYFGYEQAEVKREIILEDIISEINQGRAVIVPVNGQLLDNPNYTLPGPERHMLVIRGYDEIKEEFVTNDSGTRKGELYRYNQGILYWAIRDYLTGYHQPIEKVEKVMVVLWK